MKPIYILIAALLYISACNTEMNKVSSGSTDRKQKILQKGLPVIGLLMYEGVITTEVTAPLDVFSKPSEAGDKLFNVITIAPTAALMQSEEGLVMQADFTFENAPQVDVLFVPSAYDMHSLVRDEEILTFIKTQNQHTTYTVSNCAGAQLIGASGIADGKKIVTWIGGGKELQENYPALKVQDDAKVSFVEDGKFLSANGNLASYISSLELLEKMTDQPHRKYVESYLYLARLKQWTSK